MSASLAVFEDLGRKAIVTEHVAKMKCRSHQQSGPLMFSQGARHTRMRYGLHHKNIGTCPMVGNASNFAGWFAVGFGDCRNDAIRPTKYANMYVVFSFVNATEVHYWKPALFRVMAWCHQATGHYLSQCWPSSMLHMGHYGRHDQKTLVSSTS